MQRKSEDCAYRLTMLLGFFGGQYLYLNKTGSWLGILVLSYLLTLSFLSACINPSPLNLILFFSVYLLWLVPQVDSVLNIPKWVYVYNQDLYRRRMNASK